MKEPMTDEQVNYAISDHFGTRYQCQCGNPMCKSVFGPNYGAISDLGWPIAFAVQDGMTPADVPTNADVVFVGGTTEWKWRTVRVWASNFPRVHVGRVNSLERLWLCEDIGIESVDGTG